MSQPRSVLPAETGHWWAVALRGAVAILFGLAAFLRPTSPWTALRVRGHRGGGGSSRVT